MIYFSSCFHIPLPLSTLFFLTQPLSTLLNETHKNSFIPPEFFLQQVDLIRTRSINHPSKSNNWLLALKKPYMFNAWSWTLSNRILFYPLKIIWKGLRNEMKWKKLYHTTKCWKPHQKIPIIKKVMPIWISDLVLVFQNRLGKLKIDSIPQCTILWCHMMI